MAVAQKYRSGYARTCEITTDLSGAAGWTDIGAETGRDLISFAFSESRPSNPTSTNSSARGTEQVGTLEVTLSLNGTRTDTTRPIIDPLIEPTQIRARIATRNKQTGVEYIDVRGIAMVSYAFEATGTQDWTLELAIDAEPIYASYS